ncbi:hypothetical protein LTR91_020547 [Friedmanniomyces endolithicus]|uniref:Methyltransferase domain-containing protein n=1 Tax=Friedmanniomyces endolithicus TaxID=329885 RepID=A0AAN6HC86_9PEZI|nr:hypothetical protein LTR94_006878 [Friedmanniomyces endolithicus]KAK0785526.1 hypothetical protein LTR75_013503 [Friedmanniomyces endolithicus]KAK0799430.1 hypothetical protein LTR59_006068 [Friedmanniomyces endolithicus]KAK0809516.1 hypothetical protein LTR38_004211 [Friedmanniomyces endolithicus]KAK0835190.1 hypothetical protein LTR03_014160 [Friedmanniomyces endolithicus]
MHNAWYNVALDNRLHLATLRPGPLRILDIGYGTGIWAVEMKKIYPDSEIIAIDIGNDHPTVDEDGHPVHHGVDWRPGVDFMQEDWGLKDGSFDFIHAGMRWKLGRLHPQISGQAEFLELDWTPRCDVATSPASSDVSRWWQAMKIASTSLGKPLDYPADIETLVRRAGCTVLNHRVIDVQTAEDLFNLNADDPQIRITHWYRIFMFTPAYKTLNGMSMALLTRQLGWTPADVAALVLRVNYQLNLTHSPYYHNL